VKRDVLAGYIYEKIKASQVDFKYFCDFSNIGELEANDFMKMLFMRITICSCIQEIWTLEPGRLTAFLQHVLPF
jgi:hypothetical protein